MCPLCSLLLQQLLLQQQSPIQQSIFAHLCRELFSACVLSVIASFSFSPNNFPSPPTPLPIPIPNPRFLASLVGSAADSDSSEHWHTEVMLKKNGGYGARPRITFKVECQQSADIQWIIIADKPGE